ncbi:carbohydrate esterase family 3 protein [Neurospora crassa]|uniref:Cellulose-binding protein n=1 Tax=Neurospora crassa (strain ATCC 24698 / 74-OR23-1A / CBS 708.71 / DSM 1257 / FGSC 987) TaxID=367110 RepID=Q7S9R6_NEUCR|nr:cellulose-binding protein [Neurospora crassa OR74A]EAA33105.1 cellulose-binding protein [Neurospora crassa OR74A]KHE84021.1 carbohydrate esterase family 3 protein [Neurospora crassa]|eukprot:XP_962341.1 cellulose-binding protein [Neurospora crassa OR74A]
MVATVRLLSGLVGSFSFLSLASAEPQVRDDVRIMALGDSITGNPGCWRALLSRKLNATNITPPLPYSQIRFVGTQPRTYCGYGSAYDWPHEGHGGYLATGIAQETVPITGTEVVPAPRQPLLQSWLTAPGVAPVDIILMHLGTNDIWQNRTAIQIINAYGQLLDQMRAVNPTIRLLVAQILPMEPANCLECPAKVRMLNRYISIWAQYVTRPQSPVEAVDLYSGFNATRYTTDGVHPNARGDEAIATGWVGAVIRSVRDVLAQREIRV